MMNKRFIRGLFLLALSLTTFLPFLGRRDLVTSHEARVVQVARQMAESGWPWNASPIRVPQVELVHTPVGERLMPRDDGASISVNPWIVPLMNGEIRLQKPPLPYWCAAILYQLFGYTFAASRLVPAILGAISVLLVRDVARGLNGRVIGFFAAAAWVSSYFVVDEFRKSMADPYLAFFTLAAFWAWLRGGTVGWRVLFFTMLALGVLCKGPVIFAFVPVMILAHWLTHLKNKTSPLESKPPFIPNLIGLAVFLLIVLPWPIAVMRAVPNAPELWRYESIGAFSDKVEDTAPWWFYLPNLLLVALPWTPIWFAGVALPWKHRNRRRLFAPLSMAIIVLIFSCSFAKKNAYLLPMMPLQCLIVAQGLSWLSARLRPTPLRTSVARVALLTVTFSILIQGFVSGIETWQDNHRSPREAAMFVQELLKQSPESSLLASRLPEEVTAYFPLGIADSKSASAAYLIVDDRKGLAGKTATSITSTPAGAVRAWDEVPIPNSQIPRWKVYRLTISPVERATPGAGQVGDIHPAIDLR